MSSAAPINVLVLGGSYAGMAAAVNLLDLCAGRPARFNPDGPAPGKKVDVKITIVDERDGYYHLIGSPLAFASPKHAAQFWQPFADLPALQDPRVSLLQGSVHSVDPATKTARIRPHAATSADETRELPYDYLICATGLRRQYPSVPQALTHAAYLTETSEHIGRCTSAAAARAHGVLVVGGGAVGIEMAAELKHVAPALRVTLVHSRSRLLSAEPLPDAFAEAVAEEVRAAGVDLLLDRRVVDTQPLDKDQKDGPVKVTLSNGETLIAGAVVTALSRSVPTSSYLPAAALDEEGYVRIHADLTFAPETTDTDTDKNTTPNSTPNTFPNAPAHFCVGDLARWSGIKRCGAAMHMGHHAAWNLYCAALAPSVPIDPSWRKALGEHYPMLALAVGPSAVAYGPEQGVTRGPDVEKVFFNGDLGYRICFDYLGLGREVRDAVEGVGEKLAEVKIAEVEGKDVQAEVREVGVAA